MASKKESKTKGKSDTTTEGLESGNIATPADLKSYLTGVLDKMKEDHTTAVYGISAMRFVLNLPEIYTLLDNENRELARDIWLRIKGTGFQVKNPPLLFPEENV